MPRRLEMPEDVRRTTVGDVIDMAEIQGLSSVRNRPSTTMSARAPEAPEIRVPPRSRLIEEPPDLKDRLAAYKASQEARRSERTKAATPARQTVDEPGETSSAKAERTKRRMAEFRDFAREFNLTEDDIEHISFDKDDHPRWSKVHPDGKSEVKGFDGGGRPVTVVYRDSSNKVPVYTKSFDDDGYEVFTGYNEGGVPVLEQTFRRNDDGSLEVLFNGRDDLSPWDAVDPNTPQSWREYWEGADLWDEGAPWNNVQQDAKGGRAVRAALEGGESAGEPSAAPQAPEAPAESYSGPRIAVNPEVFSDDRDALCVALNEAFRVIMEINGFDPVAEPTDAQRRFFADTAYANDETMLRRTILARICTFDTSVGKPAGGEHTGHKESTEPTQEQLEEAVEFLHTVLEIGAPQNKWEQNVVKRILTVLEKAVEVGRSEPAEKKAPAEEAPAEEAPAEEAPVSSPEEVQGDFYGGAVSKEEEDEFKRLDAEADRQIAEEKEVKQFLEERGMEYGPGTTTMEDAVAKHTEMVSGGSVGSAPADSSAVTGFGSAEDVARQRSEMEKWAADRDANLEKKAESELGAKVFAGTATDEEKAQWNGTAQQAAAQPFGGVGDTATTTQQDPSRFVTNKAGMTVLNRDGSGTASRQAADFRGATFDRATGNWSFADGTRMTSADRKAMNDIFNRGGRFDSSSIKKGMDEFDWS